MKRPEEALQRALVQHLRLRLEPPWMFWATANQKGTRKAWEQAILAAMGMRAGMPDLFVLGPDRVLVGLELKAPPTVGKRGEPSKAKPRVSPAQVAAHYDLNRCGVPTIVCRDVDDAVAALSTLGAKFKGRCL